jgi:hypothetical protein
MPDTAATAIEAAEAIRTLNHQTLSAGWAEQPGGVAEVAGALLRLAERLPQALQQVYDGLDRLDQAGTIRMDNGTDPIAEAGRVLVALENARSRAQQLASVLVTAADGLGHMGGHFEDDERDSAQLPLTGGPELPRTTATGRHYLARFAAAERNGQPVHVYRDPSKPGSGVSRPHLDRLRGDGLVDVGVYRPLHGRPVLLTDLGRQVLAAHTPTT